VLFDLDGVLRHYDAEHAAAVERRWGLPAGAIPQAAFDRALLEPLTTGRLSRQAWVREVGARLGAPGAAAEWGAKPGRPDAAALALVDELRRAGVTAAILSNGSDELAQELAHLGIDGHVDLVLNSAQLGVAKPEVAAYEAACAALAVGADEVVFVDDTPANVEGARRAGIRAIRFTGVDELRAELRATGVPV
jgi:putative hydrolase of the HAD superfamily